MADTNEPFVWNVDMEVSLFHAMRGHKPVGVNRHFQMVYIHNKMNESSSKKISSNEIWKQLSKLYQLQALNESEILPFPNKDTDFLLPEEDYQDLKQKKVFPAILHIETPTSDGKDNKEKEPKEIKTEKIDKSEGYSKSSKTASHKNDTKGSPAVHSGKKEGKGVSTPQNKSDSKSHSTPQAKDKLKEHLYSSSVDPSPKRKRTRQTNSANASPAASASDTPPVKRRK